MLGLFEDRFAFSFLFYLRAFTLLWQCTCFSNVLAASAADLFSMLALMLSLLCGGGFVLKTRLEPQTVIIPIGMPIEQ